MHSLQVLKAAGAWRCSICVELLNPHPAKLQFQPDSFKNVLKGWMHCKAVLTPGYCPKQVPSCDC